MASAASLGVTAVAPRLSAILRRSGTVSTATMVEAPSTPADMTAHSPTGPAPTTTTVSPGRKALFTAS
jgi:hypothetical protein